MRLCAELTSATCESACGKFPSSRFAPGSYSSREQAEVVGQTEETLEQPLGIPGPTLQDVVVHQPEAARDENAFPDWRIVTPAVDAVAAQQPVLHEVLFDCRDRAGDAGIVRRQKTDERDAQEAGIQRFDTGTRPLSPRTLRTTRSLPVP